MKHLGIFELKLFLYDYHWQRLLETSRGRLESAPRLGLKNSKQKYFKAASILFNSTQKQKDPFRPEG